MKNKSIEKRKLQARLYHRREPLNLVDGIHCMHSYAHVKPTTLTNWADATFIVNNYRVYLSWLNARAQYKDLIEAETLRLTEHLRPAQSDKALAGATANYIRRLGGSRKKIVSWTMPPQSQAKKDYFRLLAETEKKVGLEVPFEVTSKLKINWTPSCKIVNLCAPFEVRSNADMLKLCQIARRLVMRESTLLDEFGPTVYGQADWLRDQKTLARQ